MGTHWERVSKQVNPVGQSSAFAHALVQYEPSLIAVQRAPSPSAAQVAAVRALGQATLAHLGKEEALLPEVVVDDEYVGDGYGQPTDAMREALVLAAREEGLLLDPVYSGKALSGLVSLVRRGRWRRDANVLFLHTGGTPGLFAYRSEVEP